MLNKVARLLLKEIRNKAPEARLKKIAKVLFKIASASAYKSEVIDNFIKMFVSVNASDLSFMISQYALGKRFHSGDIAKIKTDSVDVSLKVRVLREALSNPKISVYEIANIANDLIEKNINIKNGLKTVITSYKNLAPVKINSRDGSKYTFNFSGTDHFAHRIYLRGISKKELHKALSDLCLNLIENPNSILQYKTQDIYGDSIGDKYKVTTKVRKLSTDMYITLVFGIKTLNNLGGELVLITAYPEDKEPSIKTVTSDSYFVDEYVEPKTTTDDEVIEQYNQYLQRKISPVQTPTVEERPSRIIERRREAPTPEQLFLAKKPTGEGTSSLLYWKPMYKGSKPEHNEYGNLLITYPKELKYAIGELNFNRVLNRVGILLNLWYIKKSFVAKVQIPCAECRDLETGMSTSPFVYVVLRLNKVFNDPNNPKAGYSYNIDAFNIKESENKIDPAYHYSLETRDSIPVPPPAPTPKTANYLYSPYIW